MTPAAGPSRKVFIGHSFSMTTIHTFTIHDVGAVFTAYVAMRRGVARAVEDQNFGSLEGSSDPAPILSGHVFVHGEASKGEPLVKRPESRVIVVADNHAGLLESSKLRRQPVVHVSAAGSSGK